MMKTKHLLLLAALGTGLVATTQAALIVHYELDNDFSATVGTDASANSAATIDNTTYAVGSGSVLFGTRSNQDYYGGVQGGDNLDWSSSDERTVAFWMKSGTQTATYPTMFGMGTEGSNFTRFDIRLDNNTLRLELQGGGSTTTVNINDGEWYHIAVVVPNATSRLADTSYYVHNADGSLKASGNFSGTSNINTGTAPMTIGDSKHGSRPFIGNIDDVRVYDNALSETEVQTLANMFVPEPSSTFLGLMSLGMLFRRRR